MTVLLRDDFTGSGVLLGRTPDGVHSGNWTDDPWLNGGSSINATISDDLLFSNNASWGARVPMEGDPLDAYVEVNVRNCSTFGAPVVAVRYRPDTNQGVYLEYFRNSPGQIYLNLDLANRPYYADGSTLYGTFEVPEDNNFVLRLEVTGNEVNVFLNDVICLNAAIVGNSDSGGGLYIGTYITTTQWGYVEAGSLSSPPTGAKIYKWNAGLLKMRYKWQGKLWLLGHPQGLQFARVRAKDYADLTLRFYADGALLFEKAVLNDNAFRLPVRQDYNEIQWVAVGTSQVYSVELADDVTELN